MKNSILFFALLLFSACGSNERDIPGQFMWLKIGDSKEQVKANTEFETIDDGTSILYQIPFNDGTLELWCRIKNDKLIHMSGEIIFSLAEDQPGNEKALETYRIMKEKLTSYNGQPNYEKTFQYPASRDSYGNVILKRQSKFATWTSGDKGVLLELSRLPNENSTSVRLIVTSKKDTNTALSHADWGNPDEMIRILLEEEGY